MPTYKERLLDPRWQKKRLQILERDNFACVLCNDKKSTLHIHHRRYINNRDPWEYPEALLVTLCASCHELEKEEMSEYIPLITDQLKDKFFGDDIRELAYGINQLDMITNSRTMSEAIAWAFNNKRFMKKLLSDYLSMLKKGNKK